MTSPYNTNAKLVQDQVSVNYMKCDMDGVPIQYGFIPQPAETTLTADGILPATNPTVRLNNAGATLAITFPTTPVGSELRDYVGKTITVYAQDNSAHVITFPAAAFGTGLETLTFAGTANMESCTFRVVSPSRACLISTVGVTLS